MLTEDEYYQFFLSVLDLYGLSVIPMDNGMVKVVRSSVARTAGAPLADSKNPGKGDEIITRVVRMENVPVRELAPLLRQLNDATGIGNVVHFEPSNVLLLTGKASVVNRWWIWCSASMKTVFSAAKSSRCALPLPKSFRIC